MQLIITGGGESTHFHQIDQKFISLLEQNKKSSLLYIPCAVSTDKHSAGLDRIRDVFSSISFERIEMCSDLSQLDWPYLESFGGVYIDGGNTFELMSNIRNTHCFELFHRFLHNGGLINGDSAGAIVLGAHLETAHFGTVGDENDVGVISYQGLGFLGSCSIHCHYNESEDEEILDFSNTYGFQVMALEHNTAVLIQDYRLLVVGDGNLSLFIKGVKSILKPGDSQLLRRV
jgi:dipeptidase E